MPLRRFRNIRNRTQPWKQQAAHQMARHPTFPEKLLWSRLRHIKGWYKQKVILGYIVDFWCPRAGLVVEVDGPCHAKHREYDAHRDGVLKARGIETMRFDAATVTNNLPAVMVLIQDRVRKRLA